jgi:PAS domain S-box-containing protein
MKDNADKKLPAILKVYDDKDFGLKARVSFFYNVMIIMAVGMLLTLIYTAIIQLVGPDFGYLFLPVLIPEIITLSLILFCLYLLIRGKFRSSTHLLIITSMLSIWTIMFLDKSNLLTRFDTIVYVFAIMSMTPLTLKHGKLASFIYVIVNLAVLVVFLIVAGNQLKLQGSLLVEFFMEVFITLTFLGIVGYNIFIINKRTQEQAINDIHKRHESEKALIRSEKKYNETIDLLPQTIFEADINGNLTYVNKNGFAIFGYDNEDFASGLNVLNMLVEEDRISASENLRMMFEDESNIIDASGENKVYYALRKNGTSFPIQIYPGVIRDNGEVTGFRGIIIDISARIQAESEIRTTMSQFSSLVSNIPGATYRCSYDSKRTLIFISNEFENLCGYSVGDFIGKSIDLFNNIIHPDDRVKMKELISYSVNNKIPWETEYRIIHRDGYQKWVYEKGTALYTENGIIEFIDGFILDISERKRLDLLLLEREEKYRILFENAHIGIYQTTPSGEILNANPAIIDMLGYSSLDELRKINLETGNYHPDEGRIKFKNLIREEGAIVDFESRWRRKNGEMIDIIENARGVKNTEGEILYYDGFVENITERKKAERAFMESKQQFQILAQMSPVGIFRTDAAGSTTYVNPRWMELSGLSFEEAIGNGWLKAVHPEDKQTLFENWNKDYNSQKKSVAEYRFLKSDGKVTWVLGDAVPEVIDNKINGYIGTITDITEIKNSQEMLEKSEKRFRDLADMLPQTVWESTMDGKLTFVNKHGLILFRFDEDDITRGLNIFSRIIPEEREIALINVGHTLSGTRPKFQGDEYNAERKDGSIFPIKVYISIIYEEMQPVGIRGVIIDMSEIKEAEYKLKESEARYRSIIEAFPDIIMISDRDDNIIYGNEPLRSITGIEEADYRNPKRRARVYPDDTRILSSAINDLFMSDKKHSDILEYRFIDSKKRVRWFNGIISRIVVDGQPMLQTISRDITEKKADEIELANYRTRLELLVKERTDELEAANEELVAINDSLVEQHEKLESTLENLKLAQKQLVLSEKMASLGILAAGVAHEINNPLNFIQGGIIGIEKYFDENIESHLPEVKPLIDGINEGVRRAAIIVASLSHYSRHNEVPMTNCNIHDIIENCLIMLLNQTKHRIKITKDFFSGEYILICNEGKIHQAILNLLANAVQAIDGEGEITVSTKLIKNNLEVTISDTGCGISEENLVKIFDPFFTTKEIGKGTGLGLSITYNLIHENNGTIQCQSKVNEGTKFIITLPAKIPGDGET